MFLTTTTTNPKPDSPGFVVDIKPKKNRNAYQRELMARRRAEARDIKLPPVRNPERRARALEDAPFFLRTYFPHYYFNPFTDDQLQIIDTVERAAQFGLTKAVAASRGDGKTKIAEGLITRETIKGVIRFAAIIPATGPFAQRILTNIKNLLTSPLLAEDFPEVCVPLIVLNGDARRAKGQTVNGKPTKIEWTKDYVRLPVVEGSPASGAIIYPLSITGAVRGLAIGEERPDFILLDDPETRESARQDEQIALRETIIDSDISGLKGPKSKLGIAALVTIMNAKSLAYRLTDRTIRHSWGGFRFQAIKRWPARKDLWSEYVQRRQLAQENGDDLARDADQFYIANRAEMDREFDVSNPYRFNAQLAQDGLPVEISTQQSFYNFIADKGIDAFASEYQNDPSVARAEDADKVTARLIETRLGPTRRSELPANTLGITGAIDVGKYACHYALIAWQPEARGTVIEYGVQEVSGLDAKSSDQAVERRVLAALDQWREEVASKEWSTETGELHKLSFTFCDSGDGNLTEAVYRWVRSLPAEPKIAASKGYGTGQRTRIEKGTQRIDGEHWHAVLLPAHGIWLYQLDAHHWKLERQKRWATTPFPSDYSDLQAPYSLCIHAPDVVRQHQTFAKHQVADEYRETFIPGRGMVRKWIEVSPNNHWGDAIYMAMVAGCAKKYFLANAVATAAEATAAATPPPPDKPRPLIAAPSVPQRSRPFVSSLRR